MKNKWIDLHAHTTASDGSCTPSDLVDLARDMGLGALGITDHDTTDGLDEALARGRETGFEVVPGIEISAEFSPGAMHVLGYFVDHHRPEFSALVKDLQQARRDRNPQIAAKLNQLGCEVTMAEIEAAADGQVGRPHFAQVLVEKGYVSSVQEAFDRYLTKGGPAYVDKRRFSPAESIGLIRGAGGLPVLAHPLTLGLENPEELDRLVAGLKDTGLAGIEVHYSEHTPAMTREYLDLCQKYDLAPTGGSDFHGDSKKEIRLGHGFGRLFVPYDYLDGLKKLRKEKR